MGNEELPLPPFTRWLCGQPSKPVGGMGGERHRRPRRRRRWTQTVAVSTTEVGAQAERNSRTDNFGLPPVLCLLAVIRMTKCQGESIGRLVYLLELEYSQILHHPFSDVKRANVWGLLSFAAAVHHDEDQELSEWGSTFEGAAHAGSFNITARNQILEILRTRRNWSIEDGILCEA